MEQREGSWLPFGVGGPQGRLRLFCFPFAGGGASTFVPWRRRLPGVCVAPVQYPGRETRLEESCRQDMAGLVDDIAGALLEWLDRPYVLLGCSLGARIAFAVHHRLVELGAPSAEKLLVSANVAPDRPSVHPGVARWPEDRFRDHIRRYGGTPEEVFLDRELSDMVIPVLRADFALAEQSIVQAPVSCPIIAYAGDNDPVATSAEMARWEGFTRTDFRLRRFSGGHFFFREAADFLPTLAEDLIGRRVPMGDGPFCPVPAQP